MYISIEDSPFTDMEKKIIQDMGIDGADWGHPAIVLDDPVGYFKAMQKLYDDLPTREGLTRQERDTTSQPFDDLV